MKKFVLTATNLNDLAATISKLTPAQNAAALKELDALEANRVCFKIEKKMNEANSAFLSECENTFKKKQEVIEKYQKEYAEKKEGLDDKEEKELGSSLTSKMRLETDEIDKASKANELALIEIPVELSEEDYASLKLLLPASVGGWVGGQGESCRDLLVKVADAIDAADSV